MAAARTLILCFDGTGNSLSKEITNVIRLFAALEKYDPDRQLCYYQPGIGTYIAPNSLWAPVAQKAAKILDYGVGWYLDGHILGGYRFLMDNYRPNDKICLFGFSRGAYTARCLAGMLHKVGLLPRSNEEQLEFAYQAYKDSTNEGRKIARDFKTSFSRPVPIEFLGVWDTVSSVGIFGRELPFSSSNKMIRRFRHALALDERRSRFQPNLYHLGTSTGSPMTRSGILGVVSMVLDTVQNSWYRLLNKDVDEQEQEEAEEDIYGEDDTDWDEVWFPGCHADVGGGSVDSDEYKGMPTLANAPLMWMVNEVIKANIGVVFKPQAFAETLPFETIICHQHDPTPRHRPQGSLGQLSTTAHDGHNHSLSRGREFEIASMPNGNGATSKGERELPQKWLCTTKADSDDTKFTAAGVDDDDPEILLRVVQDSALADAKAKIHDQYEAKLFWRILDLIPVWEKFQDRHGEWQWTRYWGLGRGRRIRQPGPKFHSSVQLRMRSGYKPRATLLPEYPNGPMPEIQYVDPQPEMFPCTCEDRV